MKPVQIFSLLLLVTTLLLGIGYVFPKEGITVSPSLTLKFHWDLTNLKSKNIEYADIGSIIAINESLIEQDSLTSTDSLILQPKDTIRAKSSVLYQKIQPIEFPSGDSLLLNPFFKQLNNSTQTNVRIFHYGDSQIEGDRITGYLRNKFQQKFGGSGPGLMPAMPGIAESSSIIHQASSNWMKHAVYFKNDTILPHHKFGVLGSFARFTSYFDDSLPITHEPKNATIEFGRSGMAYTSVNNFTKCRVFYGHASQSFQVRGYYNDSLIWFEEIDSTVVTESFCWNMEKAPQKFRIEFEATKSPDIYGIALDAPNGVSVDNLPFRGSSGTEFSRLDFSQIQEMLASLNPGLILIEFGVNVVPYQSKNYDFYERILSRQLTYLKKVMPGIPILVIGVSDMSERKGNDYESYESVEKVIRAQRNAAQSTGCAFWNLYEAMGGKNSMPSWVFAHPPLASTDFIHFNRKGGHIVAQMLFNALMEKYNSFNATNGNVTLNEYPKVNTVDQVQQSE